MMAMLGLHGSARGSWSPYRVIRPLIAGSVLLVASCLPWLTAPTGELFVAWQLPVDSGWQLHNGLFNYGLLCVGCACYVLFVAYRTWCRLPIKHHSYISRVWVPEPACPYPGFAPLLCLIPSLLFLLQYLFIDMQSVAILTRGELQLLMVKIHLGYGVADQFLPIQSLAFHPLYGSDRLALLLDHVNVGLFLPLISMVLLLPPRTFQSKLSTRPLSSPRGDRCLQRTLLVTGGIFTLLVLGRGPASFACVSQAEYLSSIGDYNAVFQWLDMAHVLNPELDQLAAYHIERGRAWYFLHPEQPDLESQAYLAAYYRQQNDLLSSYQELIALRQQYPHIRWLNDELSLSLMRLAESSQPLQGPDTLRLDNDTSALSWLYQLRLVDPTNIYAHYIIGRILYDQHNYAGCEVQMRFVLAFNKLNDVQSSAYTYLALSKLGQREYVAGREYLFKAQALDPEYHNNTARQALSGLR